MDMKGVGGWASPNPMESRTGLEQGKRMGRLGLARRIVTASDDPSGAGIAARMRARSYAFRQTRDNALAGMDLTRTAGAAVQNVSTQLGDMQALATQAANGTLGEQDLMALDAQLDGLKAGLGDALGVSFGDLEVFSGESVDIALGPDGESIQVELPDASALAALDGLSFTAAGGAEAVLAQLDAALDEVGAMQAELGASHAQLASAVAGQAEAEQQLARAESRLADADVARETSGLAAAQLREQASVAMQLHAALDPGQVADLLSAPF